MADKSRELPCWSWTTESGKPVLRGSPSKGGEEVQISALAYAPSHSSLAGPSIIALVIVGSAVGGLMFMARQMFHLDFQPPPIITLADLEKIPFTRLLLVVPPGTDTSEAFGEQATQETEEDANPTIDFSSARTLKGDKPVDKLRYRVSNEQFVKIDHLESLLADSSTRAETLPVLRAALDKRSNGFKIVAFSHGDPSVTLDAEESRIGEGLVGLQQGKVLQGWRALLDRFAQKTVLLDQKELDERMEQDAEDYYRDVRQALARDEQHLLAQIAEGSLVNRELRQPLRRLFAWDLVKRDHLAFVVKHPQFRRFVSEHYDKKALREWEKEAAVGLWRHLRVPFYGALGLVVLFLLVTQRELFDVTFGLLATAAGSLAAVLKVFDSLRKSP